MRITDFARLLKSQALQFGFVSRMAKTSLYVVVLMAFFGIGLIYRESIAEEQATDPTGQIKLIRTISAVNEKQPAWTSIPMSGTSGLTWSPDGQLLAVYTRYGYTVDIWKADGTFYKSIQRSCPLCASSLAFIDGHSKLIMGPSAITEPLAYDKPHPPGYDEEDRIVKNSVLSVVDVETEKIIQHVPGPMPDTSQPENQAGDFIVSPDQKTVTVTYNYHTNTKHVDIYSTQTWQKVAVLEAPAAGFSALQPLVYSHDGSRLAVKNVTEILIYSTINSRLLAQMQPFPDPAISYVPHSIVSAAFSPDDKFLAVTTSGGDFWIDQHKQFRLPGEGTLKHQWPDDPLRIIDLSNLKVVRSLSGIGIGGFALREILWPDYARGIIFLSAEGSLKVWKDESDSKDLMTAFVDYKKHEIVASPDGKEFAINYPDGIKIYRIDVQKR